MGKDNLFSYLFHYNPYTKLWNAFKREDLTKYFDGTIPPKEVLKHANVKVLETYISDLEK